MNAQKQRTSADIIEHIADIYEELEVLPNIREHQARVAGVILVLKAHWQGPTVNWDDAVAAALLHDLGNIAKANLENEFGQSLLGPVECERIEHWKEVKARMLRTYGIEEYEVTQKLLTHINAPAQAWELISGARFRFNEETLASNDVERLLLAMADHRVGPFGVLTLTGRLKEGAQRYGHSAKGTSFLRDAPVQSAYDIAERIQTFVTISLDSITENDVHSHVQRFLRRD